MVKRKASDQADYDTPTSGAQFTWSRGVVSPAEESAISLLWDGAHQAAEEIGRPPEAFIAVLGQALHIRLPRTHGDLAAGSIARSTEIANPFPQLIDIGPPVENLRMIDDLIGRLDALKTTIREQGPTEVSSTEVRKNWAEFLDRVHANDESIYVTQHGKRVAALVPPHVAESYAADQAWYKTPQWQEMEREADEDKAAGRYDRYDSDQSFLASFGESDGETN